MVEKAPSTNINITIASTEHIMEYHLHRSNIFTQSNAYTQIQMKKETTSIRDANIYIV